MIRPLRQLGALAVLACTFALALGAGPALAQSQAAERRPSQLWQEYPLEPLEGVGPRQSVPRIRAPVVGDSSSPDRMLLIGGLALFVFVLSDTVFLALSSRVVRSTP